MRTTQVLMSLVLLAACRGGGTATIPDTDTDTDADTDTDTDTDPPIPGPPTAPLDCAEHAGCDNAVDLGNGFFQCEDGSQNRGCVRTYPNAVTSVPPDPFSDCGTDSILIETFAAGCRQLCASDVDCEAAEACVPYSGNQNICIPAECHTNADCTSGECGLFTDACLPIAWGQLTCRAEQPGCRVHSECPGVEPGEYVECKPNGGGTCGSEICD